MEENKPKRVQKTSKRRVKKKSHPLLDKYREFMRSKAGSELKSSIFILFGVSSATFGLEYFIVPNKYLDGGVVGISMITSKLIENFTNESITVSQILPLVIFVISLPFILMAYKSISKKFALKTFLSIVALSLALELVNKFFHPENPLTEEPLLIAIFGGFFLGTGIGLAIRGGSVIDGTEVLAINVSEALGVQIGEIILIINIIIFAVAIPIFGVETAMYSMVTYMSASKTVDFITNGIEEYIGVTIVSGENKAIRKGIISQMGRGVTIYKGSRGLRGKVAKESGLDDRDILFTVVTKLELPRLRSLIEEIDPTAFYAQNPISSVKGGMVKKKDFH